MYFGGAEYSELRPFASRATRRSVRDGARVLVLPGIVGSMFPRVTGNGSQDTIWGHFLDMSRGRLKYVALLDTMPIAAIDVHQASYLKLKLWL
jgi:hypothetical protein